ncbi:hypothetical protein ACTFIT_005044 [Dictyostelium discoideum]
MLIELDEFPYKISNKNGNKKSITCPIELLDFIFKYGPQFNKEYSENFKKEIQSSVTNLALSFLLSNKRFKSYQIEANNNNFKDTFDYIFYKIKELNAQKSDIF